MSADGNVEQSWSTLLNPERDLGPQDIHGISASDVLFAPKFADVAGHVSAILNSRVVVAHNIRFDLVAVALLAGLSSDDVDRAADTMSGKAKRARELSIPIVDEGTFDQMITQLGSQAGL